MARYALFGFIVYAVIAVISYFRPRWWRGDWNTWQQLVAKRPLPTAHIVKAATEIRPEAQLMPEEVLLGVRIAVAVFWPRVWLMSIAYRLGVWRRARRISRLRGARARAKGPR